ncbi:CCN family member 3 [Protopterus annectens]|uniref:CCN family member 3 n=1 Tax=Protopterus annectens TaxID=7888 RepID=UPI001CFA9635|nr:CCN family member 3 [Protopterus annectens]
MERIMLQLMFVGFVFVGKVNNQQCQTLCKCPKEPPQCPLGVPLVLDGCGCCRDCAKQLGEVCSEKEPCDETKGLHCKYTMNPGIMWGTCVVQKGDSCIYEGAVYQSGETFQPNCRFQCTCRDSEINCIHRCNVDVLLPGPSCPFPRKVQVPGECCEKWICGSKEETTLGGFAMAAYREEATLGIDASEDGLNCIEQTTEWSACSKDCGVGISSRVTNKNRHCELVRQTRICMVRPCENQKPPHKFHGSCSRTKRTVASTHFEYNNCTSIQSFRPKFCGVCTDGICCTPHSTRTLQVKFQCPQGKIIQKPVMFINSCVCHKNCPRDDSLFTNANNALNGTAV